MYTICVQIVNIMFYILLGGEYFLRKDVHISRLTSDLRAFFGLLKSCPVGPMYGTVTETILIAFQADKGAYAFYSKKYNRIIEYLTRVIGTLEE